MCHNHTTRCTPNSHLQRSSIAHNILQKWSSQRSISVASRVRGIRARRSWVLALAGVAEDVLSAALSSWMVQHELTSLCCVRSLARLTRASDSHQQQQQRENSTSSSDRAMSSTAAAAHAGDAHHPQQQPQLTLEQLVAERRWTDLLRAAQTKELDVSRRAGGHGRRLLARRTGADHLHSLPVFCLSLSSCRRVAWCRRRASSGTASSSTRLHSVINCQSTEHAQAMDHDRNVTPFSSSSLLSCSSPLLSLLVSLSRVLSPFLVCPSLITRFIWKRIHKDIKKSSKNVAIVWKLLQSLHRGDFTTYFSEAAGYQAGLSTPLLQQLNQALRQETQSANLLNIRRAYATIGVEQASPLLGTKPAETIALFTQLGWQPDAAAAGGAGAAGANQFFNPTPLEIPKQRQITEAQIEQLTRYVADLEKE
jgi:hypothetical protein